MNAGSALRSLVERVSRGVVLRRWLPNRYGRIRVLVTPDATLNLWYPKLEPGNRQLFAWADDFVRPGDIVWDVGANVGLFTFAASGRAGANGRVLAIEPDLRLAHLLQQSARSLPRSCASVDLLPVALGQHLGVARLNIAARGRAANFIDPERCSTQTGGVRESHVVPTLTLDWLVQHFDPPRVLKIDVEGYELEVLKGGLRLIGEFRPLVLVEVHDLNAGKLTSLLTANGYDLFDLDERSYRSRVSRAAYNTLAIPSRT